jgi:hypothetical protein
VLVGRHEDDLGVRVEEQEAQQFRPAVARAAVDADANFLFQGRPNRSIISRRTAVARRELKHPDERRRSLQMSRSRAMFPFIALGIAFVTLGITSNRVFLYLGIIFIVIALASFARGRR